MTMPVGSDIPAASPEKLQDTADFLSSGEEELEDIKEETVQTIAEKSDTKEEEEDSEKPTVETKGEVSEEADEQEEIKAEEKPSEDKEISGRRADGLAKLKTDDPQILKKYPWIRDMVYREEQFSTMFPTIDDAKQAVARLTIMDQFQDAIMKGDSGVLLNAIARESKPSLKKFAGNFLESLIGTDKALASEVLIEPIINRTLRAALADALNSGNKNLELSAKHISKWLHGSADIPGEKPKNVKDPETVVEDERRTFYRNQAEQFRNDTIDDVDTELRRVINANLEKAGLARILKKAVTEEIVNDLLETLSKDPTHTRLVNSLFTKAYNEVPAGTHTKYKSSIISAFLDRANTLIPALKRKHLADVIPAVDNSAKKGTKLPQTGHAVSAKKNALPDKDKLKNMSSYDILSIGAED